MYKKFISNIAGYGVFALINQLGGVILLPYYWSVFNLEQFYQIGLFQLNYYFLLPLMAFGLNATLERFYFEWDEQSQNQKIFSLFVAQITLSAVLFTFVLLIANMAFDVAWHINSTLFMSCIYALLMSTQYVPMALLRITGNVKAFGLLSNASFLSVSLCTIIFINLYDKHVQGFVIGQVVGALTVALMWISFMLVRHHAPITLRLKDEFAFAWSIPPLTFIQKLSEFADRILVERLLSNISFGTYTIAAQIGSYFNTANTVLKMAFFPVIYGKLLREKDSAESINPFIVMHCFIICFAGSLATISAETAMMYFGGASYAAAIPLIKYFILAAVISSFGIALGVGLEIKKKMHLGIVALIPSVLITVGLSYYLMPKIGLAGGVVAVLAGTFTKSAIRICLSNIVLPRKSPKLRLALLCAIYLGLLPAFERFPAGQITSFVQEVLITFFVYTLVGIVLFRGHYAGKFSEPHSQSRKKDV